MATLEDLAAKRRGLADVIVALAKVAGVDPAPYLDRMPDVTDADVDKVANGLRAASTPAPKKEPAPPRPQPPASPTTNGAGLEDKVLQSLKHGPRSPIAIRKATSINRYRLRVLLNAMLASKQIRRSGSGPRNTEYQLL